MPPCTTSPLWSCMVVTFQTDFFWFFLQVQTCKSGVHFYQLHKSLDGVWDKNPNVIGVIHWQMKRFALTVFILCLMLALFHSSDDMELCSLKVLQPEGSPSRMLLCLMAERGCTTGHLVDYLQTLGNSEALQCLKPSGSRITNVVFDSRRLYKPVGGRVVGFWMKLELPN